MAAATVLRDVPRLDARACSAEDVCGAYAEAQVVLLEHIGDAVLGDPLGHLRALFARHSEAVTESWTAEHDRQQPQQQAVTPQVLLGGGSADGSWYASVILDQKRAPEALAELLENAPPTPPQLGTLTVEPHCWLFFGRNPNPEPMPGRPEHRDDVRCEGTWHVQLAGSKLWLLRPYPDPLEWAPCLPPVVPAGRLRVEVTAGSALLVNTRLYLHETSIPGGQPGPDALSMSVARDFSGWGTRNRPGAAAAAAADATIGEAEAERLEFSSVLCTVQMCAWCGTPCSRDAAGRCGCLCCTMRRGSRAASAPPRGSSDSHARPFGLMVPRGLKDSWGNEPIRMPMRGVGGQAAGWLSSQQHQHRQQKREMELADWLRLQDKPSERKLELERGTGAKGRRAKAKGVRVKVVVKRID